MSNVHLRDKALSLKAKGLLSLILSLPDGWEYSIKGLAAISKEGRDGINSGLQELEAAGYLVRKPLRGAHGHFGQVEYVIYETPHLPNTDIPDKTASPPRYLVFFKARDVDVMTAAFKEFSAKSLEKSQKPSIRKAISKTQEQVQKQQRERVKVHEKERGQDL